MRCDSPAFDRLQQLIFRRYPDEEWAAFARFGWRETPQGVVLTLSSLVEPLPGELDEDTSIVSIREPYTLRVALDAEEQPLAVGVIHSHPKGYRCRPSPTDDDMDAYYAEYFSGFAANRPYVSLIFAERDGELVGSGRFFWRGTWHLVDRFTNLFRPIRLEDARIDEGRGDERRARLTAAFGDSAQKDLRGARVAVVGASGTGSPVIEVLARAGVGHLTVIDPEKFGSSNLERVHGSEEADICAEPLKVDIARRHIRSIDRETQVTTVVGLVPQPEVVDELVQCDLVINCTDTHHSRLALGDLASRYLLPVLDCGVQMEGRNGSVTGQIIQIVRFFPEDPCALCRQMVHPVRIAQELMTAEERERRQQIAREAAARGDDPNGYWTGIPQLNTVGYLTTAAGAMTAGYGIGLLTRRFALPFTRLQMNLNDEFLETSNIDSPHRQSCTCWKTRGFSDQGLEYALVNPAEHWPPPVVVRIYAP